eukprot:CAMPEP_0179057242 /NCGR_PEP_ID=MMETSP0796-20121207/24233_1 /TAXON_ID=73915 /ORGANISM="Pyrodinium bahamense, Strain pbaha01" /LENGTH=102 /DNA_ID=CAMNT_0020753955 /DNA_START=63 /DNA_END=371 /DNA_ORIENTATION=-
MAARRSSALLSCAACACTAWVLVSAFVVPSGSQGQRALLDAGAKLELAGWAAAGAAIAAPEAAQARLPEEFVMFAPIVDVLPVIPFFFLLLAFLWQASVGFR